MADTENKNSMIYGYSSFGYEGNIIYVETDLRRGIPAVDIVGLADGVVSDVRNRIRSAFTKQNLPFPPERVLMSLNPADIRKDGDMLPLAMALSMLNEEHGGYRHDGEKILAVGDIDSGGNILPVRGVTAALERAVSEGITNFVVAEQNANEALLVPGAKVLSVSTLSEAHEKLSSNEKFVSIEDTNLKKNEPSGITFDEKLLEEATSLNLDGYYDVCRAIEIAVAGRHNILLEGAPGSGKTFFTFNLIPALTPDLTKEEADTVKRIKSIAGLLSPDDIDSRRPPFRVPHQSSSLEGMVGGGIGIRPGELTLAHNGTLFLDEASEFRFSVLQSLRVPMENKSITLSRAGRHTMFPADAQVIMANNPCPCGNYGSAGKICLCSDKSVDQYWKKLSYPVLDRIEIKQHVEKDEKDTRKITVQEMKEHVANAYKIQRENGVKNSALNSVEFAKMCKLDDKCQEFFDSIKDNYSVRDGQNMLKVALTIANMENRREISLVDIRESAELVAPIFEKPKNFRRELAIEIERPSRETMSKFEYDGLTYIPVRQFTDNEKDVVNNRISKEIWVNPIIEKPKNGENYSVDDFRQKSGTDKIDIYYCIERGKFFTPVENGIINLNEGKIDAHFRNELNEFNNSEVVQNIIHSHRPLSFDNSKDINLMEDINSVISEGEVFLLKNDTLGDIRIKLGNHKNGLNHIIEHRMDKLIEHDHENFESAKTETTSILFLALKNITEAPATKEVNGRYAVYKNGIKTVIDTDKVGRFVVTGFDFNDTKQEAAEAIKSVNAHYGYTPEFLEIYVQVGAAYASLKSNISQKPEKSNSNTESVTIDVDGTVRECKEGLAEGFRNAVRRLDKIIDTNHEICDENDKLIQENEKLVEENNSLHKEVQKLRRELGGVGFKGN